jgi:hypothetical protein
MERWSQFFRLSLAVEDSTEEGQMANLAITYLQRDYGMLCSIGLNEPKWAYRPQFDQKADRQRLGSIAHDVPSLAAWLAGFGLDPQTRKRSKMDVAALFWEIIGGSHAVYYVNHVKFKPQTYSNECKASRSVP